MRQKFLRYPVYNKISDKVNLTPGNGSIINPGDILQKYWGPNEKNRQSKGSREDFAELILTRIRRVLQWRYINEIIVEVTKPFVAIRTWSGLRWIHFSQEKSFRSLKRQLWTETGTCFKDLVQGSRRQVLKPGEKRLNGDDLSVHVGIKRSVRRKDV